MAAALHPLRNDQGSTSAYPRVLMNQFDFGDNRYPSVSASSKLLRPAADRPWDHSDNPESQSMSPNFDPSRSSPSWGPSPAEQRNPTPSSYARTPSSRQDGFYPDLFSSPAEQILDPPRSSLSYALPPGAARRVVERYSLDDNSQPPIETAPSNETKPTVVDSVQDASLGRKQSVQQQVARATSPTGRISPNPPPNLRNSSIPSPSPAASSPPTPPFPPIMPLSASPTYNPPVSPNNRASAQQPTYVTQSQAPNAVQTVYTPIAPPQEEICVECAMRDQDMADVDVTSPGVWDRSSDVLFEELKQRELEEEANGIVADNPSRPRIKGGRLTEQNVKLWLSINPREPASRQQTLNNYIKSQRTLLEAEALAHARAMQEAKQLDSRMRDTYSQLRRSAYDTGSSSSPADDFGGVRIKPPLMPNSSSHPLNHARSHSREITLLENGMIVEHVDVRKEEKEARERKKKEEKRARKSSKSSVMDVTSIVSAQSGPLAEGSLKPYSRYSHASSTRPTSVLTAPLDRPSIPRAYSQASFSDVHSLQSSSPRRTRFFGMKNFSAGWRSQDSLAPSGMSGSMVDMHVALHRESYGPNPLTSSPIDLNTPRRSQIWPPADLEEINASQTFQDDKAKKKKGALAKIWRIVTGKNDGSPIMNHPHRNEGQEDDLPLAPPPPLSYLVNRGPADLQHGGMRHASTPSLPSVISPKFGSSPGMSPPTAPSSVLPSPSSLRASGADIDIVDGQNFSNVDDQEPKYVQEDNAGKALLSTRKSVHSATSEWELRRTPSGPSSPLPNSASSNLNINSTIGFNKSGPISRDKSLPPLPPGEQPARILPSDIRPRTVYSYDPRALPPGSSPAHDFLPPQAPFRSNGDGRRQSFGGTSSRPNIGFQTMPATRPVDFDSRRALGPRYDEFGISRRSLGKLEYVQEHTPRTSSPLPAAKRKSKFGFSSLLGKKGDKREPEPMQEIVGHQFPSMGFNPYDNQDELTTNGYATSTSRHSTFSSGQPNPTSRMSVTSRKALEELVQQDDEFVAYRYPSNDQRLDLLR